jgi:mono/diheme cytochrome c family protein
MRDNEKQEYLEEYQEAKKRGIPFFPDALFKDAIVSLLVFVALVVLSVVVGSELGEQADPSDDSFTPRPEWYFLWLFQLLKFFPGNLEFLGVIVLPGAILLILAALPWLDRSRKRNIRGRPIVLGFVVFLFLGVVGLSIQSELEAEPPREAVGGDPVALLYTENCSACHGATIAVPAGVDLGQTISQGGHAGMPAWSGDLSADEIDALEGFILSPNGSAVFQASCSECHQATDLAAVNPLVLRSALEGDPTFTSHMDLGIPDLDSGSAEALLNFLIAPDGHRLFVLNCASCHGNSVQFDGSRDELRAIIEQGGGHLTMPAMGGVLSESAIAALASYVVEPATAPTEAAGLYETNCAVCHFAQIPSSESLDAATEVIVTGGSHQTMPIWGEILTIDQLEALTDYAYEAAKGSPAVAGLELYREYCSVCHGDFGEGGINPANPAITIGPISTEQYLVTRDDVTIRAIINRGQPDSGMSPFGLAFGGPLDEEEVGAIVAYVRSWQANPPVELPPEVERAPLLSDVTEVYAQFCAQCHGADGEGGIGPEFQSAQFQAIHSDKQLFESIALGHPATAMIAWGEILSDEQISDLVELIRSLKGGPGGSTPSGDVSFSADVAPIFAASCGACHGTAGGWSAADYTSVMESGDSAPVVVPGDPEASVLGQWLLGTHPGGSMPPAAILPEEPLGLIIEWIRQGALDN